MQAVVGAAEDDAGAAPRQQARVDGREAAEQGGVPRLRALGRLGVEVLAGAGQHVAPAGRPVGDVGVVDGARLGGVLLLRGGHCVGGGLVVWLIRMLYEGKRVSE